MMNNNLITQFLDQINHAIDYKLSGLSQIKSAIVHSVNIDDTVNISIPPSQTVYRNIQNQSIYRNLNPGDNVKVIAENGNLSNMWIIGGFQLQVNAENNNNPQSISIDMIYPIGSIYMSVNYMDPQFLFGGQWERIEDRFLLGSGTKHKAEEIGGEEEHLLTVDELAPHQHTYDSMPLVYKERDTAGVDCIDPGSSGSVKRMSKNTDSTGGGVPHNNMPPYLAVYMWKRIK